MPALDLTKVTDARLRAALKAVGVQLRCPDRWQLEIMAEGVMFTTDKGKLLQLLNLSDTPI